ncbi:MAG TPA: site-specific integrase, partial [Thermoanaerobaculia bacterium]
MATITARRTENGELRYQVKVRLKGLPPQAATFRRKKEAERWAQATEAALRERRYFKAAESERRTV